MQGAPTETDARDAKIRKLETVESRAMLQSGTASSSTKHREAASPDAPLVMHVAVKRTRLVLSTVLTIAAVVVLVIVLSGRGITIETFDRSAKTIQQQEKLLERYNSYSGTVTTALEQPLAVFLELVAPVLVLRLLATHALAVEPHWRVSVAVMAVGAATAYSLGNGLSAVNVQVRELPVQMRITTNDLARRTLDFGNATNMTVVIAGNGSGSTATTMTASFSETQDANPIGNTILRNLVFPRAIERQRPCVGVWDDVDEIVHRIPQQPWMKDLVPTARETKSISLSISASSMTDAVPMDEFPMNASTAADLLLYSTENAAWTLKTGLELDDRAQSFLGRDPERAPTIVPRARLTNLLPLSLDSTEQQDRDWFWKHAGPTLYSVSDPNDKGIPTELEHDVFPHRH